MSLETSFWCKMWVSVGPYGLQTLLTIRYDALGRRIESADYTAGCTNGRRTRHILSSRETIVEYVYSVSTPSGGRPGSGAAACEGSQIK